MRTNRPHRRSTLLRSAAAMVLLAGTALAQPGQPQIDPLDILGRTFSGIRLPLAPVPGVIEFAANHASVWIEDDGLGPVQRLLLDGEVSVTVGDTTFEAKRAAVWLQRLPADALGDARTDQLFVYFEGVGSLGADAATSLQARRLSVDGVVMSGQPIRLSVDLADEGRPADAFLREAEREFTRYLREIATGHPTALEDVEIEPEAFADGTAGRYPPPSIDRDILLEAPIMPDAGDELFAAEGIISFDPGQIALVTGESGRSLMLTDGVGVLYQDQRSRRRLQMSAQRAVVFLSEGTIAELGTFKTEDIEGIYLEGDVIVSDGQYTLRGPRIYYDVPRDRAMIVDAVFWTYDRKLSMPLYVRADALRQESARQFVADQATVANTRFARPHMSIGTKQVTVQRYQRADGSTGNRVDAHDVTGRAGSFPFLWWPRWVGDPERFPLRDARVESSSQTGMAWKTTWDAHTLFGMERPDGLDVDLMLDYYNERGFAVGTLTRWDTEQMRGGVFAYLLFDDSGTDVMPSGKKIAVEDETRGLLLAENRWKLNELWTLTAEGSYISDERLPEALFRGVARERREVTTRARLDRTDETSQLALEVKGNINDFITSEYLLESRGYSVAKLPELTYTTILPEIWSGALTLESEYRIGRIEMEFDDPTAADRGYSGRKLSQEAFGIDPAQSIADRLRADGYTETGVFRADTRQELSGVMEAGPLRINPFLVGRATVYDNGFEAFSPNEDDEVRLWGAAGVRFSTTIQRVDNSVESEFLDLHRIRHIIEPGVTVWHAGSTIDRVNLPVYDDSVESLIEGTMVRVGFDQTWQTKRGGPGRWRNVDVLKLRTEYVWSSADIDREYPIGRWFEDRPELSTPGEYIDTEALWQISDPLGLTGRIIHDLESGRQTEYSTLGLLIDHEPGLRSSMGQRFINALDSTLLYYNLDYQVTEKYRIRFETSYKLEDDDFDRVAVAIRRDYPNITVGLATSYSSIEDETSIGFIISPRGLGGGLGFRSGGQENNATNLGG